MSAAIEKEEKKDLLAQNTDEEEEVQSSDESYDDIGWPGPFGDFEEEGEEGDIDGEDGLQEEAAEIDDEKREKVPDPETAGAEKRSRSRSPRRVA